MKNLCTCKICNTYFKPNPMIPFSGICSNCSETEPVDTSLYDEETEFELTIIRNIGGRVPAVLDYDDNSFGF